MPEQITTANETPPDPAQCAWCEQESARRSWATVSDDWANGYQTAMRLAHHAHREVTYHGYRSANGVLGAGPDDVLVDGDWLVAKLAERVLPSVAAVARTIYEHDLIRMECQDHEGLCCPKPGCEHGLATKYAHQARAVLALFAAQPTVAQVKAEAWDEGHRHPWERGADDCTCAAWSSSECACGRYGTGDLLSLAANPYRTEVDR